MNIDIGKKDLYKPLAHMSCIYNKIFIKEWKIKDNKSTKLKRIFFFKTIIFFSLRIK